MTWDDIIEKADSENFIGRERELSVFLEQIEKNEPKYLVFFVNGQGGVGKTTLLGRYRDLVEEKGFVWTESDDVQKDVVMVLGKLAEQFTEKGYPLKRFELLYNIYKQKVEEIEQDTKAPKGISALLGRTMLYKDYFERGLVTTLRSDPEHTSFDNLEAQASAWASYLTEKLTNKDEISLLRDPIRMLTPLFFRDLNEIAEHRKIVLCFENFEATRSYLQDWLMNIRSYKPSMNIRVVIASRTPTGPKWDHLINVTYNIPLDVFIEEEALKFLQSRGILEDARCTEIINLSGKLPILMSWLCSTDNNKFETSVPTNDIVERFLKWVDKPSLRRMALISSIPLHFNQDMLRMLFENEDVNYKQGFDWLITMPFVKTHPLGWQYHPIVRKMMLRYQYQESPQKFLDIHSRLSSYYNKQKSQLENNSSDYWSNNVWQRNTINYIYHALHLTSELNWPKIAEILIESIRNRRPFAREISEMLIHEDLQSFLSPNESTFLDIHKGVVKLLADGMIKSFELFNTLYKINNISSKAKAIVLTYRGICLRLSGSPEAALLDMNAAIELNPVDDIAFSERGETYRVIKEYNKALKDFDKAVEINPSYHWCHEQRGSVLRSLDRYNDSIEAFNLAEKENPDCNVCIVQRAETYRQMRDYANALKDLDRVIGLNPKFSFAFATRGRVMMSMNRYEEALGDINLSIEFQPDSAWIFIVRGQLYIKMKKFTMAINDFGKAIEMDSYFVHEGNKEIGNTLMIMGRYDEATKYYIKSLQDSPECSDCWHQLAIAYKKMYPNGNIRQLLRRVQFQKSDNDIIVACRADALNRIGDNDAALQEFERVQQLYELPAWFIAARGRAYNSLGNYERARLDFDRAITVSSGEPSYFVYRAIAYYNNNEFNKALEDLSYALEIDKFDSGAYFERGKVYEKINDLESAIKDYNQAVKLNPGNKHYIFVRAQAHLQLHQYDEAIVDLTNIISERENFVLAISLRGIALQWKGKYYEALRDFEIASNIDREFAKENQVNIALIYSYLGRFQESFDIYQSIIREDGDNINNVDTKYNIAVVVARWKGVENAMVYIDSATNALKKIENAQQDAISLYGLGGLEALRGNKEQALDYLRRSIELSNEPVAWARHDIAWSQLREDPLFQYLVS
ncbi:MAG: tetratricopeptide repeat protein [Roseiflexaceae bacterium]